ncbi:MAG: hypothetical protein KL787_08070 [Taibaiella sp.]|nr:hypothetical protein [Taibaiella sp.]
MSRSKMVCTGSRLFFIGFAQKEISFQVEDKDVLLESIKLNASVENLEGITSAR